MCRLTVSVFWFYNIYSVVIISFILIISVSLRRYLAFGILNNENRNRYTSIQRYAIIWDVEVTNFFSGIIVMSSISILDTLSFIVLSVIFIPFLLFFLGIVLFAYIGKTLGIQRIYVDFLVKVFEVSTYLPLKMLI